MWLWIALFTLPFMYRACRHALDALVEETLLFVAEVVRGGENISCNLLLMQALHAAICMHVIPNVWFTRASRSAT